MLPASLPLPSPRTPAHPPSTPLKPPRPQASGLPPELAALTGLSKLVLAGNPLGRMPPVLDGLRGLQLLSLARCRLAHIPEHSLRGLARLRSLNVSCNPLQALPRAWADMPRLRCVAPRAADGRPLPLGGGARAGGVGGGAHLAAAAGAEPERAGGAPDEAEAAARGACA